MDCEMFPLNCIELSLALYKYTYQNSFSKWDMCSWSTAPGVFCCNMDNSNFGISPILIRD